MVLSIEWFFHKGFLQLLSLFPVLNDDEIFCLLDLIFFQAMGPIFREPSQKSRTVLAGLLEVVLNWELLFFLDVDIC